jgi:hypothetical protein
MPGRLPFGLFALAALAGLACYAAGLGFKPGLWEVKIVKQVIDGRDMTAQLAANTEKMQQMMANMPPEQRARMQAMMPNVGAGIGDNGNFRICISPEFAKRDQPVIDKDGHCQPATVKHDGNVTTYEFSCAANGTTRQGKGETVAAGDLLTNRVDMTTTQPSGQTRIFHNESEMRYLGPDCGDIKPFETPK